MISAHHYELAFIYGSAFLLASLYRVGTEFLVSFVMRWISPSSHQQKLAVQALNELKRQSREVNPQDNFAAWARLQRQIEAEQKRVDGQQREHQQRSALLGVLVSLFFRGVVGMLWVVVLYVVFFRLQVELSREVFGMVITAPVLFLLCLFASVRVTDLIF